MGEGQVLSNDDSRLEERDGGDIEVCIASSMRAGTGRLDSSVAFRCIRRGSALCLPLRLLLAAPSAISVDGGG